MKTLLVLVFILPPVVFYGQGIPPFKPMRQDEDYSFLKNDSSGNWYRDMKFISLSRNKETYLSLGGESRFQYFYTRNENWGDLPPDRNGYILNRYLFHADLHAGKYFRLFTQLQSSIAGSRPGPSPVDENLLDLHQAFAEWSTLAMENKNLSFRVGRQELLYGSQRLVSVRDGPNNRQSFDAVKFRFSQSGYSTDLFYSHFVRSRKGVFDDAWGKETRLWGFYHTIGNWIPEADIELYYLGLKRRKAVFNDGTGEELRHSIGSRLSGTPKNWSYDIEGLYQFGEFIDKRIAAWTISSNISYKFRSIILKPELGIKTELISGDKRKGDGRLQTFNPLFPRGGYFGLAALIGPANLVGMHPSLSLTIARPLTLDIDYDIFWRHRTADGIYAVNTMPVYGDGNSPDKHIGRQLAVSWIYRPNGFLYFRYEFTWFATGPYLKQVGSGKDILFTGITGQLRF